MTLNRDQFGDPPAPKGHIRLYRGDWAPGGDPDSLKQWLQNREEYKVKQDKLSKLVELGMQRNPDMAARASVEGRWVTPHPDLVAKHYPQDKGIAGAATLVNYVDVPNHVWESIKGLKDQPDSVRALSGMPEYEAVLPEEYKPQMRVSRKLSSKEGLDIIDNPNTYL